MICLAPSCFGSYEGLWSNDREQYLFDVRSMPNRPLFTASAIRCGLDWGGSHAAFLADVRFSLLQVLRFCAMSPLLQYSTFGSLHELAIYNVVLQMGISKPGVKYLFNLFRPMKMGSSFNRLFAGVVHYYVATRGEALGTSGGGLYSCRKELCPAYSALSVRATVVLSLLDTRGCEIVDLDESGVFGMPVRAVSELWPGQCSYGPWAKTEAGLRSAD